jgi:four helix bundle protein
MIDSKDQGKLDLRKVTREFALRVIRVYLVLPKTTLAQTLGKQLLRSGTSVGAHYREACRAKSNADFVSKIEGALQELDETSYWLELLIETSLVKESKLSNLIHDADRLTSIFTTMSKSVKSKREVKS